MIKKNLSKYFKIAVFIMAIVFFTVQAVQAQATDPAVSDNPVVTSEQHDDVGAGGEGAALQQVLDGDTSNPDGGDTLVVEEGGEISTTGVDEHGVEITGDKNEVTNSGEITTTGADADGIHSDGEGNKITNNGSIDADTDGIASGGEGSEITNGVDGVITSGVDGIYVHTDSDTELGDQAVDSGNHVIINDGEIDAGADGMYVIGHNTEITNNNLIEAGGDGISVEGNNAKITNGFDGEITDEDEGTIEAQADGIYVKGNDAEITNEGTGTIDAGEDGIDATGDNNKVTNNGKIEADGDGIEVEGNENTVTNNGFIDAEDDGIYSNSEDGEKGNVIINAGEIEAIGDGIHSRGNNGKITNSGSIDAEFDGIYSAGNNVEIINEGGGIIDADFDGINVDGNDNTITNNGTITSGEDGSGISLDGSGNTLINNSSITAEVNGIYVETDSDTDFDTHAEDSGKNVIINNGTITAVEDGIYTEGHNIEITNNNLIITTGEKADGIHHERGDNAVITNNGTIDATDDGIDVDSEYAIITNGVNGSIISAEEGIDSYGDFATITNNGSIDAGEDGIESAGDNSIITNNGSIIAEEDGIYSSSDGNIITNNGTIEAGYDGIRVLGDDAKIINSGSITAEDDGIYLGGDNGYILNYGRIHVTGDEGDESKGIWVDSLEGELNTVDNYGSIYVDDPHGYAIKGETGNEIVNLFSSSDICGDIDLGEGDDIINYYIGARVKGRIDLAEGDDTANVHGNGSPTVANTITFHGVEDISFQGIIGVRNGDIATTIDPTIQSVKAPVLSSFTTGLHDVITDRLDTELKNKSYFWADSFNSYRERGSEDLVFRYDHQYNGVMFGYDVSDEKLRFGIMTGYSIGRTDGEYDSFETDSDSYFAGIYGQFDLGKLRIATSLLGGYEDHEDERMVIDNEEGYQTAKADYDSWFFSPSIKLSRSFNLSERLFLEPSATAAYSIGWYESYEEDGTVNSNLGMDDRTIDAFSGKLQLKSFYRHSDKFEIGVYGGLTARYTDDEIIDGNFGGTGFSYSARNDDSVYGEQFGAYIDFAIKDNFDLNFKVEHGEMDGDEKRDFVTGGFQIKF